MGKSRTSKSEDAGPVLHRRQLVAAIPFAVALGPAFVARAVRAESPWRTCAKCGHQVAPESAAMEVGGHHLHRKTNPQGKSFDFGTFREAPGASATTPPTVWHTWFPGYAWSTVVCAGCREHVGWKFTKGSETFYGLLLEEVGGAAAC